MKECLGKQKTEEKEQYVPDDQLLDVQVMTSCPPPPERELSVSISPTHTPDSQAPDTPPDMRLLMAATGDRTDLGDRFPDIHEAAMEVVEAQAQQEDDADDVEHRKNRLKKKYFDDAFDKLPDHAKELMLEAVEVTGGLEEGRQELSIPCLRRMAEQNRP